ncbi:serine protease inhibitor 42Dd-like [Paramacrobiotus metropolitanus]|uniref:serine protease inhibitor 42Dd-like n=1 Tax=Paramacrobiotus metropolitanus TaxID=2943436 RepID=UPI00244602B8|nr:serine protease inhibitor 42Dd-like [Paramacrobiotus metropolitanus]
MSRSIQPGFSGQLDLTPSISSVSVNLYNAATAQTPTGNLMVSPLSIMYCTMLVFLGAKGKTRNNLYTALDFNKAARNGQAANDAIVDAFSNLMNHMKMSSVANNSVTSGKHVEMWKQSGDPMQLTLANGVFIRSGLNLNTRYATTVSSKLKATIQEKNFKTNSEGARRDINRWVENNTAGKIKHLLPPGAVTKDTQGVMANAIYFKASWDSAFEESNTFNSKFTLLNGRTVSVKMMRQTTKWRYATDDRLDIQYLEIPYMDDEASMLVFLPRKKAGLRVLERELTAQMINDLSSRSRNTKVNLQLPKFKVESQFDLKALLEKLGVKDLFTDGSDLSGIVSQGPGLKISQGFHKTFIEVDEKGTEAAGASAVMMVETLSAIFPPRVELPIDFIADHPFMYAIRHNPSKAILFIGRHESF